MGSLEPAVRSRLQAILPSSDHQKTSERDLRVRLEEEMGVSMDNYKPVIKEEVSRYLDAVALQEAGGQVPAPLGTAAATTTTGTKRKHDVSQAAQGTLPTAILLSALKRAEVRWFKGSLQIDIRELYKDKASGELKPGLKGLVLTPDQWATLTAAMPAIDTALGACDTSYVLELSDNRRATISEFKAEPRVDLREYYEADGQLKPGKKGISLQQAEWQELRQHDGHVQAAVDSLLQQSAAAGPPEKLPRTEAVQQSPAETQDDFAVSLSSNRRASVRTYNGRVLVDLRETYEKDGQTLPGKKGVALTADQFRTLKDVAEQLTRALQSSDVSCSHALGDMRKASVTEWKNVTRVSVREFYVKKGESEERPGQKGLDMPADEWNTLCTHLDALHTEMERLLAAEPEAG